MSQESSSVQLVELQLAKLAQRIKVRVDRHEAPSTRLLDAVLELLADDHWIVRQEVLARLETL